MMNLKRTTLRMVLLLMVAGALANACKKDDDTTPDNNNNNNNNQPPVEEKEDIIEIKTKFGNMYMYLYDSTPKHRENFLKLAGEDYFDSTTFHRVVKDFVIQGGDPNSKDSDPNNDGQGGPGYTIEAEIKPHLYKHDYGAVGAARTNNPEKRSSGSQFYIVTNENGTHNLDGQYTVFGIIIKGMDVAEKIEAEPTNSTGRPNTDIVMDVNILEKTKAEVKLEFGFDVE